ncbi:aldo/keto reductase [Gigaspora margarita]|uniref:Aldo/keto reductase n=1 Tax=Gigaspora margarita TaxID=4874 RepID=A0A8H4ET03_GIGMA|nr:aldo/keto reductase [Gigaspora margarita]
MLTVHLSYNKQNEKSLGEWIADKRSQVVIATKYTFLKKVLLKGGNHRKSLVENLDESLRRLGTGYNDLMFVHYWEFCTSIEEVTRSLDDIVRRGKVLYIALSDAPAWHGQFIGLQTRYNLLNQSLEHDIQTACAELDVFFKFGDDTTTKLLIFTMKVGIIPWGCVAEGTRTKAQLVENLNALEFKLTPEQIARLDAVSAPKEILFPYPIYSHLEKLVGKEIQIPDKYKPVFMMKAQEKI